MGSTVGASALHRQVEVAEDPRRREIGRIVCHGDRAAPVRLVGYLVRQGEGAECLEVDIDHGPLSIAVCGPVDSKRHLDGTTGLDGPAGRLGRANLPVIIHPDLWSRRWRADPVSTTEPAPPYVHDEGLIVEDQRHDRRASRWG